MFRRLLSPAHPSFSDIFVATLGEKCTYIAPQYLERKNYASVEAYMAALGYEPLPSDSAVPGAQQQFEGEEQYFERMVGYVSLYAAYAEAASGVAGHPHGLERAWTWLARLSNQRPRTATAAVLHAFLAVGAYSLQGRYPAQTRKLLEVINADLLLRMDSSTPPRKAAQAVLALWLQTTLHQLQQYGRFEEPKGRNMPQAQESDSSRQEIHHDDQY